MHRHVPGEDRPRRVDTDAVRAWVRRVAESIGIGIPAVLVGASIISGESLETIIWNGIMGVILGLIVMYGITPQSFSLFPPARRRRRR